MSQDKNNLKRLRQDSSATINNRMDVVSASSSDVTVDQRASLKARLRRWFSAGKAAEELCDPLFWHDVLVETVLCTFFSCSIIWVGVTCNQKSYTPSAFNFALYAGFFIFILIEGWRPLSGASINPVRNWSSFLVGHYSPIKALLYTIVGVGGNVAGANIANILTPEIYRDQIVSILPGIGVTAVTGMAIEAILTFNTIFIGLIVTDPKLGKPSPIGALVVGFSVGTGVMAAGTLTGGLQNPSVSFSYAVISHDFTNHWLYWVGPYLGSTVASLFYILLELLRTKYGPYHNKPQPRVALQAASNLTMVDSI